MLPGETLLSGASRTCTDCGVDVLTRLWADRAIYTGCGCAYAHSRESEYMEANKAQELLASIKARFTTTPAGDWMEVLRVALTEAGVAR